MGVRHEAPRTVVSVVLPHRSWKGNGMKRALLAVGLLGVAGACAGVVGAATNHATASAPVNTAPPAASGSSQVGQTLTASTGTWTGDSPISYAFAWDRCDSSGGNCNAISGASAQSYTITSSDAGSSLRIVITASNGAGTASASSAPTGVVGSGTTKPTPTAQPNPHGTAQIGQTVYVDNGTWSGTTPMTFTYQWQRCNSGSSCSNIGGATNSSYLVGSSDNGYRLRATVTATNTAGSASIASNTTGAVVSSGAKPSATKQANPSGTAQVGQTISVDNGTWSGSTPITYSYQWERCNSGGSCSNIGGATKSSYVATTSDVGYRLRAKVTASNSAGSSSIESNTTAAVTAAVGAPGNTTKPTIAGSTTVGSALRGSVGAWSGQQPISFALSWLRCDTAGAHCQTISGATASTYTLASADAGSTIVFSVRATNAGGTTTATSVHTAATTTGPAGAIRLPGGKVSIPVTSVSLPDRLVISGVKFNPNPVRSRSVIQARFRVTDSKGNAVRGALVYALGLPYGWTGNAAEVTTGNDGYAYIYVRPTQKLPLATGNALVVFVRARKPGDSVIAGVSTRRLVQVLLRAPLR